MPPTSLPRILVVLAAFRGMAFLPAQMASILAQQGVNVQVVVSIDSVDGDTEDGTWAWAAQIAAQEPRISILPTGQIGGGAAPNFFRLIAEVDLAGFDYLAFADQDDLWHPDKLTRACQQLQHTGAEGYSGNVTAFWPSGKERPIDKAQPQKVWDFLFEGPGPGCTFVVTAPLALALQKWVYVHRSALKQVGFHDWLIYAWARTQGYLWTIDKSPHMHYRQHAHNQIGANTGMRSLWRRVQHIASGWGLGQACLMAQLMGLEKHPFVASWYQGQRWGLLQLAGHAGQCRRRRRDQILFVLSCAWMAVYLPGRGKLP